ncbi:MAG: hypothetical protein KatS3mg105_2376 [Gemmatales bacterium]|nr:MAG: hypothetical protein KatS3mg105_2376 [Gemmatales bacterium]
MLRKQITKCLWSTNPRPLPPAPQSIYSSPGALCEAAAKLASQLTGSPKGAAKCSAHILDETGRWPNARPRTKNAKTAKREIERTCCLNLDVDDVYSAWPRSSLRSKRATQETPSVDGPLVALTPRRSLKPPSVDGPLIALTPRRSLKPPFVDGPPVALTPRRSLNSPLVDGEPDKLDKLVGYFHNNSNRALARTKTTFEAPSRSTPRFHRLQRFSSIFSHSAKPARKGQNPYCVILGKNLIRIR